MLNYESILASALIVPQMTGHDCESVIESLIDALVSDGRLDASLRDKATTMVMRREMSASTVMEGGIAFPHARLDFDCGADVLCVIGVSRAGVPFAEDASVDPVHIVVLILSPVCAANGYLYFCAQMGQRLMNAQTRTNILAAETSDAIRATLV